MGLDMYLTRKIYIGANYKHNEITGTINLKKSKKQIPLDKNKILYIEEDAGYWRKANQIHKWFVDNIQKGYDDCKNYEVSIERLKDLLKLCKEVKEKAILVDGDVVSCVSVKEGKVIQNAKEIAEILPTQAGFFFGNTDYNEYYIADIEDTIKIIEQQIERENELREKNIFTYLEYRSSW